MYLGDWYRRAEPNHQEFECAMEMRHGCEELERAKRFHVIEGEVREEWNDRQQRRHMSSRHRTMSQLDRV